MINRFTGLAEIDKASDKVSVETLAGTITTHMANLSAQTAASIDANMMQMMHLCSRWQHMALNSNSNSRL